MCEIVGDTNIFLGDIINFVFPKITSSLTEKEINETLSGKFLITAIRHDISRQDYRMVLELSKDSYE